MSDVKSKELVDAVVIGGGPAGFSAAINLARARWTVALVERARPGRSDWGQINQNYFGFPDGVSIVELGKRGRQQAERFGVRVIDGEVRSVTIDGERFNIVSDKASLRSRGLVIATGVEDRWVDFPGYEQFIGRSMHWCIDCDGYEMANQRVLVVGNDEEAAEMAMQLLRFAKTVSLLTNEGVIGIADALVKELSDSGISLLVGRIVSATSTKRGYFRTVVLEDNSVIELDHLFSAQGATPNTALARAIGVELNNDGYIKVDTEAHTNLPGVVAAGDVTRLFSHQVATAVHEGATAAGSLSYYLFQQIASDTSEDSS